jgi:nitrite reductase/ring-hydroxylating ferredoxin subunit
MDASAGEPGRLYHRVPGGVAILAERPLRAMQVAGRKLVVARDGENYYASPNRCPHFGIQLAGGRLDGNVLECRWHHWRFDLATGLIDAEESEFETTETFDVIRDGADLLISVEPKTRLRRYARQDPDAVRT